MKNLMQKIGTGIFALGVLAGAKAYAEQPITFADQKAYDNIATANEVLYGLPVNKTISYKGKVVAKLLNVIHGYSVANSITESFGDKTITYSTTGSLDRTKVPDWNSKFNGLAKMADRNHDGVVTDGETEDLAWDTYNFEYQKQNQ